MRSRCSAPNQIDVAARHGVDLSFSLMRCCFLIWLVAIAGPLRADDALIPLKRAAASDIRAIAEAIERFAVANNHYPRRTSGSEFVSVEVLAEDLVPDHIVVVPAFDPWGGSYWYWTNGEHFIVGSEGSMPRMDSWRNEIDRDPRGPAHAIENLCRSPGEGGVLLVDGRFCELPKDITHGPPTGSLTDEERGRLTIGDLRAIALAVTEYGIDNNVHPVLTSGLTDAAALRPLLEPDYMRTLPLFDAWGNRYFYWSDGKSFLLYSTGGDAEDRSYGVSSPKGLEDLLS